MTVSALERECEKYGCAKRFLDPKLHDFDSCFGGKIRLGDIDASVEKNGFILWLEWKRGAVLNGFEDQFFPQFKQATEFTKNSNKQTFVFVVGDPVRMTVEKYRVIYGGKWRGEWKSGRDQFEEFLRTWFRWACGIPGTEGSDEGAA